jgi:ABC-type polysaccharide/polyol phosphate transport system ATPase subunit
LPLSASVAYTEMQKKPMNDDIAIRARDLTKTYRLYNSHADRVRETFHPFRKKYHHPFNALTDVSFEVRRGETLGIIGRNGSGKSTLLQIMCGILQPTSGSVELNGRVSALLELGAGFNPEFTGRQNVYINGAILGLKPKEMEARFDDIAAFADIGDFIDQPVKTYSSGMYVRLAFATAVNVSSDILMVDEVLSVGDFRFQQKCISKIKEFCEKGTVIFISHDLHIVLELCSRAIWIESGRMQMDGLPKLVLEKYVQYICEGDPEQSPVSPEGQPASTAGMDTADFTRIADDIRQFGDRRAVIQAVRMRSRDSNSGIVYSGFPCEIAIIVTSYDRISRPMVGYIIRDRLGRKVLADNNARIKKDLPEFLEGQNYIVTFTIDEWPNIIGGDYTLSVAVADGDLDDYVQCHFLHDALIFKSIHVREPGGIFSVLKTDVSAFMVNP